MHLSHPHAYMHQIESQWLYQIYLEESSIKNIRLLMNTDSFINNRIRFIHWITQFLILFKKKISFTNEQNIRKVSQKIGSRFFSSRKLCLNFKIDLNFFLQIFNALITLLIASINNINFWPMRINQFLMSFQKNQ